MAGLCEGGNEPPGSLKAIKRWYHFQGNGTDATSLGSDQRAHANGWGLVAQTVNKRMTTMIGRLLTESWVVPPLHWQQISHRVDFSKPRRKNLLGLAETLLDMGPLVVGDGLSGSVRLKAPKPVVVLETSSRSVNLLMSVEAPEHITSYSWRFASSFRRLALPSAGPPHVPEEDGRAGRRKAWKKISNSPG
ncbi:hypothetical protein ANN_10023 [Periplaneta americana]|uniref:Uncharacterized protein n=1 Tax=Periplaneta americana TaxID=6978 RepID=A0ABQ8TNY3_PERAM|nr:hypothetical protein ANN_10023 [Periplaneta americana]